MSDGPPPPRRLLIVEDDPATRKALVRIFRHDGWEVAAAETVAEGLAGLDPAPDGLILDLMLPDGGGEAVLRRVRERGLPTRVAVCTGAGDPGRLAEVAALGPDALLRKPVSADQIRAVCGPAREGP